MRITETLPRFTLRDKPNHLSKILWVAMMRDLNKEPRYKVTVVNEGTTGTDSIGEPSPGPLREDASAS